MKIILYVHAQPPAERLINYFHPLDYIIHHAIPESIETLKNITPDVILIHTNAIQSSATIDELNAIFHCPIIVMNDIPDETSCVMTLEQGADDFVLTNIHPRELYARINAIARRITKQFLHAPEKTYYQFDEWCLYPASRKIQDQNNKELSLSISEYQLMYAFVTQPQKILSRDYLLNITKHNETGPLDRRIDVQISRLRHKLDPVGTKPFSIKTIRNGGYVFTSDVQVIHENTP